MLGGTTELWLNITYNYGKIYRRDSVFGKDGKTPLTPVEWAESLKETAPHLFPRAEGSGAGGHKPGGGGGSLKRSEMSSSDKADYIRKHGQQAYLKLPK